MLLAVKFSVGYEKKNMSDHGDNEISKSLKKMKR